MRTRLIAVWLFCLAFLCGCGSDSGQFLPTDGQGNFQLIQSNESQLNARVRLLPNDGSIQVVSLTGDSITLQGQLPPLSVGDIVSRSEGDNQFIRRIASIQTSGNQTTIATESVGLDDVFDQANINITTFMGPEFLKAMQPELQGVTFGEPVLIQPRADDSGQIRARAEEPVREFSLPVTFNEAIISDGDRGSVTVSGAVNLRFAIHSELEVGTRNIVIPTVKRFALQPIITVDGNLTVTGEGSGDFRKEVVLTRIAYPLIGPFPPVSLYLAGDLVLSVDGQVQANGQLKMSGRLRMQAGVDCTNDQWTPVSSVESNFSAEAPQIFAQARLNANVFQPRLSISLLDMGQVYINANLLRFEVEADATESSFNVQVFRTYSVEAGAKLNISAKLFGLGVDIRIDRNLQAIQGPRVLVGTPLSIGKPPPPPEPLPLVILSKLRGDLKLGKEARFEALPFVNGSLRGVPTFAEWSSSNPSVLQVRTFGVYAYAKAIAPGRAEVRARVGTSETVKSVNVSANGLRSLLVIDEGAAYRVNSEVRGRQITTVNQVNILDSKLFRVMGVYDDQSQEDITYSVDISSGDPSRARTFRNGQVLGISSGLAAISASFRNLSALTNIVINIPQIQFMHITPLDPVAIVLDVNQNVQLKAVGRYDNGNVIDTTTGATWRSLSPSIASVVNGKVTGLRAGETVIEAVVSSGAVVATKRVRVNALEVTGVEVEPGAPVSVRTGSTVQFRAFARYSDNSREEVTTLAKWFSNNDGVGSISNTGLLTLSDVPGRIKVKATYNYKTGSSEPFEVTQSSGNRTLRLRNPLPTSSNVGRLLPLDLEVLDGNLVDTSFNGEVTVSKGPNSGTGNLTGVTTIAAQNGVVHFPNLSFDSAGLYNLVIAGAGAPDLTPPGITVQAAGFEAPANSSTGVGTRPLGLAFGNLNGDSVPDLVTANGLAQSASVLINNGQGSFAAPVNQPIGANSPEDVAVADMNGDGREDFVVVSQSTNGVHLFLRQPDGTFTRNDMAAQTNPFGVAVGPVTQGDTRPDIVVANVGSASVTVLSQAPNGGYSPSHFGVGQAPNAVALGDLNGDGRVDIVTSNFDSNSVSLCYQNADGTFNVVTQAVSDRPEDVVIDNIDGDGRPDLAVACASGQLTLLLQKTADTFTRSNLTAGNIPVAVATGDINGDGRTDVVVGNLFGGNMTYYQQTESGGFTSSNLPAGTGPRALVVVDLNGDGRLDIACANETSSTVTVILTR